MLLIYRWSSIASQLPGRTDNEIKNYWNTHLKKKLMLNGIDPMTHRRRSDLDILASIPNLITASANINVSNLNTLRYQLLQSLVQLMSSSSSTPNINFLNSLDSSFIQNHVLMQDLSLPQLSNHYQTCANPNFHLQTQEIDASNTTSFGDCSNHALFNSFVIPMNNSSPSLVLPTSPGMFTGDQMREPINSSYISANSSSEEPSLDDLDIDFSWKNILE